MKKLLLVAAASILFAGAASAADLPRKAPPPAPIALYNWTGFYIGGNAGYTWSDTTVTYINSGFVLPIGPAANQNLDGFLGGGQVGYNWQSGKFVLGVEADAAWRDNKASTIFAAGIDSVTFTTRHTWLATFRPRAGIAANNWLFYVTGGAAAEGLEHSYFENRSTVVGGNRLISSSDTRWGWTVGAGVEAGFGQWSAGFEYLYVDFDRTTSLAAGAQVIAGVAFGASSTRFDDSAQHVVRAKLNYRFGGPVVAKY
jgi:outer membrane immunogenic protein